MQEKLGAGLDEVLEATDMLRMTMDSFSAKMLQVQQDMHADIRQIKQYLVSYCGMSAAEAIEPGRIRAVCFLCRCNIARDM